MHVDVSGRHFIYHTHTHAHKICNAMPFVLNRLSYQFPKRSQNVSRAIFGSVCLKNTSSDAFEKTQNVLAFAISCGYFIHKTVHFSDIIMKRSIEMRSNATLLYMLA